MPRRQLTPTPTGASPTVIGLDEGRRRAQRQHRRRRSANRIKHTLMYLVAFGAVGGLAYVGWSVYAEQADDTPGNGPTRLTPDQAIERLENQPKWNGPGNPNFGVGTKEP